MIICPKCSKELEDTEKICDGCGTKIVETTDCPDCEKAPITEPEPCQEVAPSPEGQPEAQPEAQPDAQPEVKPTKPPVKIHLSENAIKFGVIGVAVIAALILIISLLVGGGNKSKNNYALYLKDSEIFYTNLKNNKDGWQLTSRLVDRDGVYNDDLDDASYNIGNYTYMSENGKYIFFPDKVDGSPYNLYYKKVSKPDSEAIKVDSSISSYTVNKSATVVTYLKDGILYQYSMGKDSKDKVASDVDTFKISDNGKKIIYVDYEDNIYLKQGNKDKEKIASGVSGLNYVTEDLDTVYYTKENSLYKKVKGKDSVKIASDIYSVINIYESGEIYYLTRNTEELSLIDYVTDDMKDDESITEPVYPSYPEYPEYPSYPEFPSSPDYPYSWDYDTDEEHAAAIEAYNTAYAEWEEECNRLEEEHDKACEEYSEACEKLDEEYDRMVDKYYEDRQVYWSKESRDELREDLKDATLSRSGYVLCYYNGKEATVITDSFNNYDYTYSSDAPVISYDSYSKSEIKKVKISEIKGVYEVRDMVEGAMSSSTDRYIAVKGKANVINEEKNATSFRINSEGTLAYYIDDIPDGKNYGTLYQVSISKNKIGKTKVYDTDVYTGSLYFAGEKDFAYFKDVKNGKGELYINKDKVDYDVELYCSSWFDTENDRVIYFTDWNDDKELGTLKMYNGKKAVKVSDDAHSFTLTPDGRILYLYDYSIKTHTGELYEWKSSKTRLLDYDVISILPISSFKYRSAN